MKRLQPGFTMVEILVATAILALTLLVAVSAYVSILDLQQKGNSARETQQSGRAVMEAIAREIRSSTSVEIKGAGGTGVALLDTPGDEVILTNLLSPGVPIRYAYIESEQAILREECSPSCGSLTPGRWAYVSSQDKVRITNFDAIYHDDIQPYIELKMDVEQGVAGIPLTDSEAFKYSLQTIITIRTR